MLIKSEDGFINEEVKKDKLDDVRKLWKHWMQFNMVDYVG